MRKKKGGKLPPKKLVRRIWTFDQKQDQERLYDLVRSGIGNHRIMRELGYTLGQISYARRLLKEQLGMDLSLYNAWRLGVVPFQMEMIREMHAVRMTELRSQVVPKLVHPTPETVKL